MSASITNQSPSPPDTPVAPPARVAVIAHTLHAAGGLSVGKNLVASLHRVAPQHQYLFLLPAGVGYENLGLDESRHEVIYHERRGSLLGHWLFSAVDVKRILRQFRPDLVLCLGGQGVSYHACPQAVLCHDAHLFYPVKHFAAETLTRKLIKRYQKWRLARDLRHTQLLLCQTAVAEQRLKETFSYRSQTALCPNAVSRLAADAGDSSDVPETLAPLAEKFTLLCLTRYYPHKNLERIVDTFVRYRDELRDVAVVLTVSAGQHAKAGRLLRRIEQCGLADSIVNVGPLPQPDLAKYYRNCQALFLPTLLESFSGTYLEAMHFGTPILTSDLDFARDVCGEAAVYFDPWAPRAIKDAILNLKNDPDLARNLVANGKVQLESRFLSWDAIARNVVEYLGHIPRQPVAS